MFVHNETLYQLLGVFADWINRLEDPSESGILSAGSGMNGQHWRG
jgi:hypothetical protein